MFGSKYFFIFHAHISQSKAENELLNASKNVIIACEIRYDVVGNV